MSEDVHSSTFPRVTDICANQVAPFLSRYRVIEKLIEKVNSEKVKTKHKYRNVTRYCFAQPRKAR